MVGQLGALLAPPQVDLWVGDTVNGNKGGVWAPEAVGEGGGAAVGWWVGDRRAGPSLACLAPTQT